MRATTLLAFLLCCSGLALAQASRPASPATAPSDSQAAGTGKAERTIERIHHEDKGSRIDELRMGGETKNITVSPKGDLPSYEVNPESSDRNPSTVDRRGRTSGPNGWKVLGF